VRQSAELESQVISVERLEEYAVIESEAPPVVEGHRPPKDWPTKGDIAFERTAMRYRPNLPLVLRGQDDQGLVCTIQGGQKVRTAMLGTVFMRTSTSLLSLAVNARSFVVSPIFLYEYVFACLSHQFTPQIASILGRWAW